MQAKLDHVVLWVADPLRSLEFYEKVVGLTPVRADEFREGKAPFPSVGVSSDSIIDLMAKVAAPLIDHMVGVPGTREHGFGEDRRRAGEAEHLRVGAPQDSLMRARL
jgi:glyoxylase I family protein